MPNGVEQELQQAVARVLRSNSRKKLIVAGPGAGKTNLFRRLLDAAPGTPEQRLVLTFLANLKADLEQSLGAQSNVFTLHGYCQHLLRRRPELRQGLTADFRCYPGLVSLIKEDWRWLGRGNPPAFVDLMRRLVCPPEYDEFYVNRADYYDAVDFDDSVYRTYRQLLVQPDSAPAYELVLVDEFQDFNPMEAAVIELLARRNPIVMVKSDPCWINAVEVR